MVCRGTFLLKFHDHYREKTFLLEEFYLQYKTHLALGLHFTLWLEGNIFMKYKL